MKRLLFFALVSTFMFSCKKDDGVIKHNDDFLSSYDVVASYDFDENSYDNSGNKLHLTNYNTEYSTDRFGKENSSVFSNGNNSYLKSEINNKFNLNGSFTISVWVKPDLSNSTFDNGNYVDVIGRWFATGNNASSYSICLLKNGNFQGRTYNYSENEDNTWIESSNKIQNNDWNNIIITRNNNGIMYVYLNGEKVSEGVANTPQTTNYELFIFKRRDNRCNLVGSVDDVIILDNYLDSDEVKKLMEVNL